VGGEVEGDGRDVLGNKMVKKRVLCRSKPRPFHVPFGTFPRPFLGKAGPEEAQRSRPLRRYSVEKQHDWPANHRRGRHERQRRRIGGIIPERGTDVKQLNTYSIRVDGWFPIVAVQLGALSPHARKMQPDIYFDPVLDALDVLDVPISADFRIPAEHCRWGQIATRRQHSVAGAVRGRR
jgi:hypothetical protein